jgi:hypothetical protein
MNSAKNITLGWALTRGPHMSETDAALSRLPIGPTVSLGRICSWNQPNAARMTTNLPGVRDSTIDSTTSPSCGFYLTYIVRLAQWIEITNTFPLVVKWFGFPRQVDPKHVAPDPISPLFCLSSFFVISCHFIFCSPKNVSCDKYYHRCKKLNSKACIHVKNLKLHHLKGTISKNIWLHQKFLVGGSFVPHCLSNLCNALSECFYTRVLLGSFECF